MCSPCDGQPERSQQFGFSHSRLHCATLREQTVWLLLGALISLAELGIVQTGQHQTVGVVYFGLHCATLRVVNREILNTKTPVFRLGFFCIGSLAVCYSRMASATLPSPQLRFTSEFGMESGGSTALLPPGIKLVVCSFNSVSFKIHHEPKQLGRCMVKPLGQLV